MKLAVSDTSVLERRGRTGGKRQGGQVRHGAEHCVANARVAFPSWSIGIKLWTLD